MKISIVGLGSIGKRHFHNLIALGYRHFILVTQQNLEDLLPKTLNVKNLNVRAVTNLFEALKEKPDVVFVCNETSRHIDTARTAAEHDCHIFLEKPVSHTWENLDELAEKIREKNLKLQVGFQFRYHPVLQGIRQRIQEGRLGKIISAQVTWGEWLPGWHPYEDYRNGYAARRNLGGGVVLTLCHPFDYLCWMLGEAEVLHAAGGHLSGLEIDTEDTALVTLRFENDAFGAVYLDYISRPPRHTLHITGTEGSIEWDAYTGSARIYTNGGTRFETLFPGRHFERNELFIDEVQDFMDCIKNDKTPKCTLEEGIRNLRIALSALDNFIHVEC